MFEDSQLVKQVNELTRSVWHLEGLAKKLQQRINEIEAGIGKPDPYGIVFWTQEGSTLHGRQRDQSQRMFEVEKWKDRLEDYLGIETIERRDGGTVFLEKEPGRSGGTLEVENDV
jgi:hypothetical protein